MFGFLKKIFGLEKEVMKDAGVQLEQHAPYKVEAPKEVVVVAPVEAPPKPKTKRKPAAKMTAGVKKPATKRSKKV